MPISNNRLGRGVVRGATAAGINAGFQYLIGGGFNPYTTGILLGASILDSLFSEDPPPPPPRRTQVLLAENIYKRWVFGYVPVPMQTLFAGSFRRDGAAGLPERWTYGIGATEDADRVAAIRGDENIQGWSVLDMFGYLSEGQMEASGIRGIFIDDVYVPLENKPVSDYPSGVPLYYPLGFPINGDPLTNFTGKLLVTPSFELGDFPSLSRGVDPAIIYRTGNPAWGEQYHQSDISYCRVSLIEQLQPKKEFWTERAFPSNIRLLAEGIKVRDLSQYPDHENTSVWTDNAISIRYHFEREIVGLGDKDLDMSALLESYNKAEKIINYNWNAHDPDGIEVVSGQDASSIADRLPARGRRYSFNGIISTEQPNIQQIRDRLDFACNGRTVPSGTTLAIIAGQNKAPVQVNGVTIHFRDDDFVENPQRIVQPDIGESFNALRVRYKSQIAAFDDREIVISDTQAVARDGNREIVRQGVLAIEDAPSDVAVQGRVIAELVEHRNDRFVECIVVGIHTNVRIGDAIKLSSTALEINNRTYTVANRELNFQENQTKFVLRAQSNAYADRFVTPELQTVPIAAPDEITQIVELAGVAGEDGDGFEYVFRLTAEDNAPTLPANDRVYDWQTPTDSWTDRAPESGTTAAMPFLWLAIRVVPGQPEQESAPTADFGNWLGPIKIAEFAKDSQFQEFIFKATASNVAPPVPVATDTNRKLNEDFPEDWSDNKDDPQVVSDTTPFVWMSYRTKDEGTPHDRLWSAYSPPVILTIREIPPQQFYTFWPRGAEVVQYATFGNYERTGRVAENSPAFVSWVPANRPQLTPPLPGAHFANSPSIPPRRVRLSSEVTSQTEEVWIASTLFNIFMRFKIKADQTNYDAFSVTGDPTNVKSRHIFNWWYGAPREFELQYLEAQNLPFDVWYTFREFDTDTGVWGDFQVPTKSGVVDKTGYVPPGYQAGQVLTVADGTPAWGTVEQRNITGLSDELTALKNRLDALEAGGTNVAPTLTATNVTQTSFTLTWSGGSVTTGNWTLQERDSRGNWIQRVSSPSVTTHNVTGKTAGSSTDYRVRRGTGQWRTLRVFTLGVRQGRLLATPVIRFSAITQTGYTISWFAASTDTGLWQLQEQSSTGAWVDILSGTTSTSTSIGGKTPGTAFKYRVRRQTGPWGEGVVTTAAAQGVATAPTLGVRVTTTVAFLSYSGGSVTTGAWQAQYKLNTATVWIDATGEGGSSVAITGLTENTAYDFRVRRGTGPWATQTNVSTLTSATTPGTAPTVTVTTTHNTATVSYSGGGSTGVYRVQYRRSGGTGNIRLDTFIDITGEGATSATITDLRANTAYDFRVQRGNGPWATVTNISTTVAPAAVPSNVHAESAGRASDRIQWDWNNAAGATSYEYYLSTSSTAPAASATATGTAQVSSIRTNQLTQNTTYYLWVRSVNSAGKSAWSSSASAATTALAVPTWPASYAGGVARIIVSNNTRNSFVVTWPASPQAGIQGAFNYRFQLSALPNFAVAIGSNPVSRTDRVITQRWGEVSPLYVRVRAENGAGNSPWLTATVTRPSA